MSQARGRGRPKGSVKYHSDEQRKRARTPLIKSRYFRLVIPNLQQYRDRHQQLLKLKGDTLSLILAKQNPVGLQYYKIAVQTHSTGVPHLDILLLYKQSRLTSLNRFDYLVKHGDLTRYRKLNQAILTYGDKEDCSPLTNLPSSVSEILTAKALQSDPYAVMREQMKRDPFYFNAHEWLNRNNLDVSLSRTAWSKHISLLRHQQEAECNQILHDKPGFQPITRQLIESSLTTGQCEQFTRNGQCYWPIIDKINQIYTSGFNRPHKSRQLLLVGRPDTGKTALARKIRQCTSVYSFGVSNWFPAFRSNVYKMILWNQFNLRTMPYPQLLNILEGQYTDLQYKGGSVLKTDNQLIYMTSNMTLEQHICSRFKLEEARELARLNLRARIDQIVIPDGVDLFLLLKLIRSV